MENLLSCGDANAIAYNLTQCMGKTGLYFLLAMFVLKGVAHVLGIIAAKTETKSDDRLYEILTTVICYTGLITSKFGFGNTPGAIIDVLGSLKVQKYQRKTLSEQGNDPSKPSDGNGGPTP